MAHRPGWETEFLNNGFSLATVSFFRDMAEVAQPGTISLDVTELESLMHEFRLVKNRFDDLSEKVTNLEIGLYGITPNIEDVYKIKEISANYTTSTNETLLCTATLTVTLNQNPKDSEQVTIKNSTGIITISGTIDGESSYIMVGQYESKTLKYYADNTAWSII